MGDDQHCQLLNNARQRAEYFTLEKKYTKEHTLTYRGRKHPPTNQAGGNKGLKIYWRMEWLRMFRDPPSQPV